MPQDSTTVRISRRTHRTLSDLAERRHTSVTDLLEHLVESARRTEILSQYNNRMSQVLSDKAEREAWTRELAWSDAAAEELTARDAPTLAR